MLDRIVSLCRARQCAIVALRFEAADRHGSGRVSVTVAADGRHMRLAAQRLAALPGVIAVAHIGGGRVHVEVHTPAVTEVAEGSKPRTYR